MVTILQYVSSVCQKFVLSIFDFFFYLTSQVEADFKQPPYKLKEMKCREINVETAGKLK